MEEAGTQPVKGREETDLSLLVETAQALAAFRRPRDHQTGGVGKRRRVSPGEGQREGDEVGDEGPSWREKEDEWMSDDGRVRHESGRLERDSELRMLRLSSELSELHSGRVTAWKDALGLSARILSIAPLESGVQLQSTQTNNTTTRDFRSHLFDHTLQRVENILRSVEVKMNSIKAELDAANTALCAEERPHSDTEKETNTKTNTSQEETPQTPCEPQPIGCSPRVAPVAREPLGQESGHQPFDRDAPPGISEIHNASLSHWSAPESVNPPDMSPELPLLEGRAVEKDGPGTQGEPQCASIDPGTPAATGEEAEGTRGGRGAYVTLGMTAQSPNGQSEVPDACYVTAPVGVAEALTCEVADALSSLVVIGSEELVSRVLRVKVQEGALCHFPITLAVPFGARYRGNYREVVVKVMDGERRASYITPISTEGTYGGQRGSYAEVRVYAVGLLAVVSRLRRESHTVPRRGLSIKLSMDPRVCLDYLPGSFPATVVAQSMIQPVDATLLAALKSRSDWSPAVVSTSPVLHLTHPSSLPLRRPLTLTLPCPPNPDKRRAGQGDEVDPRARSISAAPVRERLAPRRLRALSASVKTSREATGEALVLLGWREEQWNVLDHVTVRNLLNGLVTLELTEIFDRLMVVRLLSSERPSHLTSLAEEVEEAVRCHTVTVVLLRHREEAHAAVAAALLTRDLSWELSKLRAQGYSGPPETSQEIPMCEGEQLLVSFSGNITSTAFHDNPNHDWGERITFHSQRKSRVFLRLTEVDPFGNHSSPHYKGTAIFHRVARGQLEWRGDRASPLGTGPLEDPVCKLPLTLPKKVRVVSRPFSAQVQVRDETAPLSDPLLRWLSEELSEEEVASLVLRLHLRRSSIQLVRLQAPDSLPAQAFHLLATWRRGLPAAPHPAKAAQLACCLAKSGRPDLARELLLRQASTRGVTDE